MAFFQKKPLTSSTLPIYTLGLNTTVLIVGLGNPGKEYIGTRHNIGFEIADSLAKNLDFPDWITKRDLKCDFTSLQLGDMRAIIIKPTTYMNLSGEAVQAVQHFYKINNEKTLVIHDELDIEFGQLRTRMGGSSAGHNGIKSVTKHISENYGRLRVGIGPKKPQQIDSSDFVLARFNTTENKQLPNLIRETNSLISEFIYAKGNLLTETRSFIV